MTMLMKGTTLSLMLALVLLTACGGGSNGDTADEEKGMLEQLGEAAETMKGAAEGMKEVAKDFEAMENREPVPPVHYEELMKFLPDDAFGLTAKEAEGETGKMGEWQYSQASIEFTGEDGEMIDVQIFDYAYISVLYAPYKMALAMGFSKESTKGYERSTEILGFPGFEKWAKSSKREEVTALVGQRYIVTVKARNLEEGQARELLESMNLLELADTGAQPS